MNEAPRTAQPKLSDYLSHHVYSQKAAMTVYADKNRQEEPTVGLDFTNVRQGEGTAQASKGWDWSAKDKLQLVRVEIPAVAAVLLGIQSGCSFNFHGNSKERKKFALETDSTGKIQFKVNVDSDTGPHRFYSIPVEPADAFYLGAIVLTQMRRLFPGVDGAGIHMLLRRYSQARRS